MIQPERLQSVQQLVGVLAQTINGAHVSYDVVASALSSLLIESFCAARLTEREPGTIAQDMQRLAALLWFLALQEDTEMLRTARLWRVDHADSA